MSLKINFRFPTAFTILFFILIFVAILTYFIPSGEFSKLTYNDVSKQFYITNLNDTRQEPATQEFLDKSGIKLKLETFKKGIIRKPIAIPNTYHKIEQHPQGFINVIKAPIEGVIETADIIILVLVLGGIIGVINKMGIFNAGITALSKKIYGKEFILVSTIFFIIALGGTTFGMAEEIIAFYPILMPIFLISGFDAITCIASIYLASSIGTMFSTTNPFSVVVASNTAGINFTSGLTLRFIALIIGALITLSYIYRYAKRIRQNPRKSLVYEDQEKIKDKFLSNYNPNEPILFTNRMTLSLSIFALLFPIIIWGVASQEWWLKEMATLFLAGAIVIMFLSGLTEKEAINGFIMGVSDLVGVALILGIAKAINIIMTNGFISDTLLYYSTELISQMNISVFVIVQFLLFIVLGFFIPSSSGLAVLSMPILAPLADTLGLSREVIIHAYNWGQGLMLFIAPTGLILVNTQMAGITFNKWLKFVLPLIAILGIYAIIMLIISTWI